MKKIEKWGMAILVLLVVGVYWVKKDSMEQTVMYNPNTKMFYFVSSEGDTAGVLTAQTGRKVIYNPADSSSFMDNPNYSAGRGLSKSGLTFTVDSTSQFFIRRYGTFANRTLKQWYTVITVTSASGFSVGYSYVGFTATPMVFCSAMRNTATGYLAPQVAMKSVSNTAATFNLTSGNNSLVTILGLSVLNGAGTTFDTDPTSITLTVTAIGY